jgi:hypothetical protein
MKYRLLKDCPHGRSGSIWIQVESTKALSEKYRDLIQQEREDIWSFPANGFSDWFEEIKEMPKITKQHVEAILQKLNEAFADSKYWENRKQSFEEWLDKNTET